MTTDRLAGFDSSTLTVESMVRASLHELAEEAAVALEELAARVRLNALDLDRVGSGGTKTYVGVATIIAADATTTLAQLRLDRLAGAAVDADVDRALRAASDAGTA